MNSKSIRRISIWLVMVFFVIGCALPFLAAPTPVPVPSTQSSEILGTSIVQTVDAAQTLTATSFPPSTTTFTPTHTRIPTSTFTPTPTFFFSLYTATLVPSQTSAASVSSLGGTDTGNGDTGKSVFTGKEWTCTVTAKIPGKGAVIQQGVTFYAYWEVLNTGTKTWTNNGVDFLYLGGMRMDGRHIQDLPLNVAPGNKITLKIQLTAPKRADTYSTIWTLKVGRRSFCPMKITFDVK